MTLPLLAAPPREVPCAENGALRTCVVVIREDWRAVVRELKAACLATGQPAAECQTDLVIREDWRAVVRELECQTDPEAPDGTR